LQAELSNGIKSLHFMWENVDSFNDSLPNVVLPSRVREGKICPAGLGRGKHAPQG